MSITSLRRIVIEAVEQNAMRSPYDQLEGAGDWFFNELGELVIRVDGPHLDDRETLTVALHELVEAVLCRARGIEQRAVDAHDALFEAERGQGAHADDAEPGDDERAPYVREHRFATLIEVLMEHELGNH